MVQTILMYDIYIFMEISICFLVFWVSSPRNLVSGGQRFRWTYYLYVQRISTRLHGVITQNYLASIFNIMPEREPYCATISGSVHSWPSRLTAHFRSNQSADSHNNVCQPVTGGIELLCFLTPCQPDEVTVQTSEVGLTPQLFNVGSLRWTSESRKNKPLPDRLIFCRM
jgi:hypothetical protein